MDPHRPVRCPDNAALALHLLRKRQDLASSSSSSAAGAGAISEKLDLVLTNAHRNICAHKSPITSLKDLSQIKGVGKWILRMMKGFFPNDEPSPTKKGKQAKGPKRYAPQKNSVSYALLITLYREMKNGVTFMKKKELIDAAEASGLARTPIGPDKAKAKPSQMSSARDWYTGWNCMKTLISKGLVVKSSCPAKYMLTEEGQDAARECLLKSGLVDSTETSTPIDKSPDERRALELGFAIAVSADNKPALPSADLSSDMEINDTDKSLQCDLIGTSDSDPDSAVVEMDYPARLAACTSINKRTSFSSGTSPSKDLVPSASATASFSLQACGSLKPSDVLPNPARVDACTSINYDKRTSFSSGTSPSQDFVPTASATASFSLRACCSLKPSVVPPAEGEVDSLAMPPCNYGDKFEDTYDLILILDDRETFGSRKRKVVDSLHSQFKILVEVRRLPIGDGIWIVRHKQSNKEFVLDFIVERKNVNDLCSSIRDNRYRDQKLRLQRCGLQKLIYLVEGDLNSLEAAESLKTACFTTEILEGFDIQRTTGFADTVRRYGHLTQSIFHYCCTYFPRHKTASSRVCPSFVDFVKKCQDLEKMTVSDVFALQLMQVPQVTEDIALAVVNMYPTVLSLARAYSLLEGNIGAQEEMLKNKNRIISGVASRNIYKLVWG